MIRQINLELVTGFEQGRKAWFLPGQRLVVGGNEQADFAIASDTALHPTHFVLEADHEKCCIRDLTGQPSIGLHGNPVASATLFDGDRFVVGESRFIVRIVGGMTRAQPRSQTIPVVSESKPKGNPIAESNQSTNQAPPTMSSSSEVASLFSNAVQNL